MLRFSVTDEQGILLDSFEMTREEFFACKNKALGALSFVDSFEVGR